MKKNSIYQTKKGRKLPGGDVSHAGTYHHTFDGLPTP